MVLETFVAYAFNSYIADYFDNINVDQLKIAFEKGEVELERLPLKKDALKQFNLPVDVLEGIVGKISIKIPILALLTEPWIVKIKDLTLTVAPVIDDADETMQSEQGSLDSIEWTTPEWRTYYDARYDKSYYASSYTSWLSSVKSVVCDIYKNIQLEVETLNIHYEDINSGGFKLDIGRLCFQQPDELSKLVLNDVSIIFVNNCLEDLALVEMDHLTLEFSTDEETHDTQVKGTISCLNITDLNIDGKTPTNTSRNLESEIIDFKFTKYKRLIKDNNNSVEKDLVLEACVSSMQYIHSSRFCRETINYIKSIVKSLLNSNDEFERHSKGQHTNWWQEFNKLIDINIENGTLYVIDDDKENYLPMLQIPIQDFNIWQCFNNDQRNGQLFSTVSCNYYNRELSGWQLFLEPWKFHLTWDLNSGSMREKKCDRKLGLNLKSNELIKMNLTSSFLDLYDIALREKIVELKSTFFGPKVWNLKSLTLPNYDRRVNGYENLRPKTNQSMFLLKNETGCRLHFRLGTVDQEESATQRSLSHRITSFNDESTSSRTSLSGSESNEELSKSTSPAQSSASLLADIISKSNPLSKPKWISVEVDQSVPFDFNESPIARLKRVEPNQDKRHVLTVRIEGWKSMSPISLDTVGVFFREASSDQITKEDTITAISIVLDGNSARKIISIRSGLQLLNKLDTNMEVHFVESDQTLYIMPDFRIAVPMNYLYDTMFIRPCSVGVTSSEKPLDWEQLRTRNEARCEMHICHPITVTTFKQSSYCTSLPYRVAVLIQREDLEDETLDWMRSSRTKPAHCITFQSPLTIVNLLPDKMQYFIEPTNCNDTLEPGKEVKIHNVDTSQIFNIYFVMENFPKSKPMSFSPGATRDFTHILEMIDERNRSLFLQAKVLLSPGESPSMQVLISAPYWFVNKTDLPIIFKQEGGVLEAAGQFNEHEETRIKTPLLFSFYDSDCPMMCSMRLGKSRGQSRWCRSFYIESGNGVRRLRTMDENCETGPCVYEIAIEIRKGTGMYQDTQIVTFSSRHGFDSVARTPISIRPSPQQRQLISYNPNASLAERIANHAMNMFSCKQHYQTGFSFVVPGLTVTVVDKFNDELILASFEDVAIDYSSNVKEHLLNCSIQNVNIYNQLEDAEKCLALSFNNVVPEGDNEIRKPAVRVLVDRLVSHSFSANVFKQVQLSLGNLVLNIEEKLILKLINFIGYKDPANELHLLKDHEGHKEIVMKKPANYYLGLLRIDLSQLCLSVMTSSSLPPDLERIKEYLGFKLIQFEGAHVEFTPYMKMNVFETLHTAFESIGRYYKAELKRQAARILGAVLGRLLNIRANWIGRR